MKDSILLLTLALAVAMPIVAQQSTQSTARAEILVLGDVSHGESGT